MSSVFGHWFGYALSVARALLGRIARYGVSGDRNAREDRSTEILAAVFDSDWCDGLARYVAIRWLDQAAHDPRTVDPDRIRAAHAALASSAWDWRLKVTTQKPLKTSTRPRRLDLELSFEPQRKDQTARVLLWIEVKLEAQPERDQLQAYADAQQTESGNHKAVLLLAPRARHSSFDEGQVPPEVVPVTWEDTAHVIDEYPRHDDRVGEFLVEQLIAYLREERLVDPPVLTSKHLEALANYREGLQAITRVCEVAAYELNALWAPCTIPFGRYPKTGEPGEWWWVYPHRAADGRELAADGWNLNFRLRLNSDELSLDDRPGAPVLMAGMTTLQDGGTAMIGSASRARLEQAGFKIGQRPWEHVMQVAYPDPCHGVLFGDGDVSHQGVHLARWINEQFTKLSRAL
jgi:hypothetical protein